MGFGQSPFKKNQSKVGFGPIPVQEESLNSGVRANPRSKGITQQRGLALNSGVRPIPVQKESLNSGVRANPPFKKNHSTVGFGPTPVQEEPLNNGVRPISVQEESLNSGVQTNPHSRRTSKQRGSASPFKKNLSIVGFGQSPFKKNHSTVGFGSIPVQEESLNSGVRANPCSRRITQQCGSRRSAFKKNCATRQQFRLVLNDFELDMVNYALRSA